MEQQQVRPIIFSHGSQEKNNTPSSYFVVPVGIFVWILKPPGHRMSQSEVNDDLDLLRTPEGRRFISGDFFDEKCMYSGYVTPNVQLFFNCTFRGNEKGFTTGIITNKLLHKETIELKSIKNDEEKLMNILMEPHDDQIIPRRQIWNRRMSLGEVVKLITNAGKFDGIFVNCCRVIEKGCEEVRPQFFTVTNKEEIYHSNIYAKINTLKRFVEQREYPEFFLRGFNEGKCSKLKLRVTLAIFCEMIEIKLAHDNSLSSFLFHGIIEIFHAKAKGIPLECVVFSMEIKLKRLIGDLERIDSNEIIFKNPLSKSGGDFRWGNLYICKYFMDHLEETLIRYQKDIFDYVIFTAETVINHLEISDVMYKSILSWYDKLR